MWKHTHANIAGLFERSTMTHLFKLIEGTKAFACILCAYVYKYEYVSYTAN